MASESQIIAQLRRRFPRIGDDAAVLGSEVVTNDMLIEDVDFTSAMPPLLLARKSLAVNLSDLAAMGAGPRYAVVAVGIAPWLLPQIELFFDALAEAADEHRIEIVGGDLSRSAIAVVSITATGHAERPLLRSGARPGDRIYVSRVIGGSASGLYLLQHGWSIFGHPPGNVGYSHREFAKSALRRHLDPEPELRLGLALARIAEVSSCIDISDGLSSDLHHLCEASECGADIERERIPMFPDLLGSGSALGIRPQDAVLHGGEEYALLFTSTLRESELSSRLGRPVYAIGRMSKEPGVRLNGEPLEAKGFDHFA